MLVYDRIGQHLIGGFPHTIFGIHVEGIMFPSFRHALDGRLVKGVIVITSFVVLRGIFRVSLTRNTSQCEIFPWNVEAIGQVIGEETEIFPLHCLQWRDSERNHNPSRCHGRAGTGCRR